MPKSIFVGGSPILLDELLNAELGPVLARQLLHDTLLLNPGLAEFGAVIPAGRSVLIPDRPAPAATTTRPVVSLFG